MKNEMDSKFILSIFEKIRENGEKKGEGYFLGGITAFSDYDGYTIFMEDQLVKLRFGFHNQYHFDYEKDEHMEQFEKKLNAINTDY
ncbi:MULTISPECIES: DUF3081 domain-containing protein [Paraglaciecola]|jgi:hypothetical protein|uniref:DUF3081 domain-containing protein n=4 Tax=Paraglaciecola TaxID=1621534 RepID=A0A8H9I6X1_9ALTE|nr:MULTISPECIES: DUF3081 domain-containing protein [Paraglaciecola]AEE24528.1 hypothetical protein Glaag_3598 [Glaciecola sp. 4H-3-7+YE-5]MBN23869.1 DUF3081 domain-containing protein [Alteromonadaceae bacterium]MBJ2136336.1 DUF3081 domain-containing protein [Paraglaciecola chathamensis]MBU3018409.1 DUF3081 domain-containing protein [Paraglaciecola agarilytica]MDO6560283.1 DUF3081 domain-containing protein [Paraglaciecola chathamensis]|tara:strand:+ start:69767 stop:70024 length:258 start_codon:yes stop_codon:yes gene_type:complete